jgi:hypothetical protein
MADKTTSGAVTSSADGARADVVRVPDTLAEERSDISETLTQRRGREQAHLQARRHRHWLRTRNPDGDHKLDVRAATIQDAGEGSPDSARDGERP